jgi:hypothetical protein
VFGVHKASEISQSQRRRVEALIDAYRTVDGMRNATRAVSRLNMSNRVGDKMVKAGVALVVFPEPFVSDLFGSLLIGAGLFLKKRSSGATLDDLKMKASETLHELKKIREGLEL